VVGVAVGVAAGVAAVVEPFVVIKYEHHFLGGGALKIFDGYLELFDPCALVPVQKRQSVGCQYKLASQ
jgi:hypothetical protein